MERLRRLARWLAERTDEIVLSGLAGIFFLVAANTQTGWLYLVSSVLTGLLLMGYAGPRRNVRDLKAEHSLPRTGRVGETVTARIRLSNLSARSKRHLVLIEAARPWQEATRERHFLVEELAAGGTFSRTYPLRPAVRGAHRLDSVGVATEEPFGLFRTTRELKTGSELLVYPRGPRLSRLLLSQMARRRAHRARTFPRPGASHDLRRIRPYGAGEDIRYVHWPSSARVGELMIREFREPGSVGLYLALDNARGAEFGRFPDTSLEDAVASAAALVDYADRTGLRLHLAAYHGAPRVLAGVRRSEVLEMLARVTAEDPRPVELVLEELSPELYGAGDLYLLTSRVLPPQAGRRLSCFCAAVLYYPRGLYEPGAADLEAFQASRSDLEQAGVSCRVLADRARLGEFLEGRL